MKIIDFHTHTYPDKIAQSAILKLESIINAKSYCSGKYLDTIVQMRNWGIDGFVPLNIVTNPSQHKASIEYSASLKAKNVFPFGSVYPLSLEAIPALDDIKSAGLFGVKLHPDYQGFMVDDEAVFPVYERCEALGLPIIFHSGFDFISPNLVHCSPQSLAKVADIFPNLTIIAAHLGGYRRWDDVEKYLVGKENVWFDTALLYGIIERAQARRIIIAHKKVLFGSDCPWHSPKEEAAFIRSLSLGEELLDKIFSENAIKLLNI